MKLLMTSLLAMVVLSTVSCSKDEGVEPKEDTANVTIDVNLAQETDWAFANEILKEVNAYRVSQGFSTLKRDQQYGSAYATDHTKYMIEKDKISHDNFGYRSNGLKQIEGAESVGENVAYGYRDAQTLVQAWINSPSHRSVLEGNYSHTGFGVVANDQGSYYFTQLFYRK